MANRVYPDNVPNANVPLGYDGSDFRAPRQDGYGVAKVRGEPGLGYSDRLAIKVINLNIPAGDSSQDSSAVPAGEVWVITRSAVMYTGTSPTYIDLRIQVGDDYFIVLRQKSPGAGVYYYCDAPLILKEGDLMRFFIKGGTLNDNIYVYYVGYIMKVEQTY